MKRLLFLLDERCRRVNRVCSELGRLNVCLVSIHVNAAELRRERCSINV